MIASLRLQKGFEDNIPLSARVGDINIPSLACRVVSKDIKISY